MAKKVCYITEMKELPQNCLECTLELCTKPCWQNDYERIKKPYRTKRHRNCPLKVLEVTEEKEI